jgi:hypothetical protein
MNLLTVEPRALLIQDMHDYLGLLRGAVKQISDQVFMSGLTEERLVEWIVKEQIEQVYHLFSVNHDSRDWRFAMLFHQVRNLIDLDYFTGQYIKVPTLYGDHCFIDLEIRGIDLYMWYFPHTRLANTNYHYQRKWN